MTAPIVAYPLQWPPSWPQTRKRRWHGPFKNNTLARARESLALELERLGAKDEILSTNVPLRIDGQPRGDFLDRLADPGVAVYFTLRDRSMVMARDAFEKVSDNLRSLALAIEYLRGMERHGGAHMLERVFTGFAALPAPMAMGPTCWQVLDLGTPSEEGSPSIDMIERVFREKAKTAHPDTGGSDDAMARLNNAREQALREIAS